MLRERVITALLLAPCLIWIVLWAPFSVAVAAITVVILLGAWEWSQFCGPLSLPLRIGYVVLIAGAIMSLVSLCGGIKFDQQNAAFVTSLFLTATIWWLLALGWILLWPQRVNSWCAAIAGLLVLTPTWLALVYLRSSSIYGRQLLLFLLVLVVAADVGAYFCGRSFGRVKLAPRVSPGKTWEGAFGGIVGAVIVAIVGARWFRLPSIAFIGLCCAVAVASIVGDLTESMFKRNVGLKDSSNLLPGHGGILDRMDSITAAAPLFALGMAWLSPA